MAPFGDHDGSGAIAGEFISFGARIPLVSTRHLPVPGDKLHVELVIPQYVEVSPRPFCPSTPGDTFSRYMSFVRSVRPLTVLHVHCLVARCSPTHLGAFHLALAEHTGSCLCFWSIEASHQWTVELTFVIATFAFGFYHQATNRRLFLVSVVHAPGMELVGTDKATPLIPLNNRARPPLRPLSMRDISPNSRRPR